jgi:hypothetical protein
MCYALFSFKKKLNLCQRFVGQGFSLIFKIPHFISPFEKGGYRGIYCICKASALLNHFSFFTKQSNFTFSFLT